jgi:MFS superfamily sulfate permease-like transporter
MKKVILGIALSFSMFATHATGPMGPFKEYFTHDSSLRPYVQWIAKHTRFTDAEKITVDEIPPIEMLNSEDYRKLIDGNSIAVYALDSMTIFINTDKFEGRPDVVIHELVHFYQHREAIRLGVPFDNDQSEKEAIEVNRLFLNSR